MDLGKASQRNRLAHGAEVGSYPGRSLAAGCHDRPRRGDIDAAERVERIAVFGCDLQDDVILVNWRIDRCYLLLAEGGVQNLVDRRHVYAIACSCLAIDRDHDLLAEILLI